MASFTEKLNDEKSKKTSKEYGVGRMVPVTSLTVFTDVVWDIREKITDERINELLGLKRINGSENPIYGQKPEDLFKVPKTRAEGHGSTTPEVRVDLLAALVLAGDLELKQEVTKSHAGADNIIESGKIMEILVQQSGLASPRFGNR